MKNLNRERDIHRLTARRYIIQIRDGGICLYCYVKCGEWRDGGGSGSGGGIGGGDDVGGGDGVCISMWNVENEGVVVVVVLVVVVVMVMWKVESEGGSWLLW